tara:strand:- start:282 stop:1382 length:1101 start_codon:yes stop_codon:yes gene_type:complete
MKVAQEAGIDFYKTDVPEHEKEMKLFQKDYDNVEAIYGADKAQYFANKGFFGTGTALNDVSKVLDVYNMSEEELKKLDLSSIDEIKSKKSLDFDKKRKTINEMSGLIGPYTLENQFSDIPDTTTQTTDTTEIPQPVDFGTLKEGEVTDEKVKTDIGTLFTKKPETQGIEAKYNNIKKAVNETMNYGSPIYNQADGTTTFNISDQFQSKSQAHIQIASAMTKDDDSINQLDAVARSKQELDNQTVIPFKIIAMSLGDNTEYREGHGKANAILSGVQSRTIDSANTTVKRQVKNPETNKIEMQDTGVSIFQYLTDVYNNDLLKDGQSGKVNSLVFKKFLENIPPTIMYGDQSLKSVIAQAHESSFFKL